MTGLATVMMALAASLLLSWLLETLLLSPRAAPPWRRPPAANALHAGLWLLDFALLLAVTRRPGFTLAVQAAQTLFILGVSHIKWRTLREPFIAQDFEYFADVLRHPRLYLPFFGLWRATAALAAFIAVCALGLALETPLAPQPGWIAIAALGAVLLAWAARQPLPLSFDPVDDHARLGSLATGWHYARAALRAPTGGWPQSPFDTLPDAPADAPRPALVMVQAESFFDARRHFAPVRRDLLPHFDALRQHASAHGPLHVPPWGANTVRSEYALLSGLPEAALGVHRFNPYHRLARQGIGTLATWLRRQGYRTVCVHPYPAGFYRRDVVYPLMGFDRFIDIAAFAGAPRDGAYVSDAALGEHVARLIEAEDSDATPLFVLVLTMESHGPLHLDAPSASDEADVYACAAPARCAELTTYLRHLRHADRLLGLLHERLAARARPAVLSFHGDHVPPMPSAYAALGAPDGTTDYVVWRSGAASPAASPEPASVESLGLRLLQAAGLAREERTDLRPDAARA